MTVKFGRHLCTVPYQAHFKLNLIYNIFIQDIKITLVLNQVTVEGSLTYDAFKSNENQQKVPNISNNKLLDVIHESPH